MPLSIQPISSAGIFDPQQFASNLGVGGGGRGGGPGAYGYVPAPVAPGAATSGAISSNLSNLNNLYSLASGIGAASGAGGAANLNTALPGATTALGNELQLGNTLMAGQLPADVTRNLEQTAAERGVMTGAPGSDNSNAALLRDLGLTTLDLEQMGTKDVQGAVGQAPRGPEFNPASQLITPGDVLSQLNYNSDLAAAPNPEAAAMTNLAALGGARSFGGGGLPPGGTESPTASGGPGTLTGYSNSPYTNYGGQFLLNPPSGPGEANPGEGDTGGGWSDNGDGTYTTPYGLIVDADGRPVGFDGGGGQEAQPVEAGSAE